MAEEGYRFTVTEQELIEDPSLELDEDVKTLVFEYRTCGRIGSDEKPLCDFETQFWFSVPPTCVICGNVELKELDENELEVALEEAEGVETSEQRVERLKDIVAGMIDEIIIRIIEEVYSEPYMVIHRGRDVEPGLFSELVKQGADRDLTGLEDPTAEESEPPLH